MFLGRAELLTDLRDLLAEGLGFGCAWIQAALAGR